MAFDPNAPNRTNNYLADIDKIRENLNQLRVHEIVINASDIDNLTNLSEGMIVYVSSEKAYYGIFNINNVLTKIKLFDDKGAINADTLDNYHAGNASGNIPINNATLNTNLNADMVDGLHGVDFIKDPTSQGLNKGVDIFEISFFLNNVNGTSGEDLLNLYGFYFKLPPNKGFYVQSVRFALLGQNLRRLRIYVNDTGNAPTIEDPFYETGNLSNATVEELNVNQQLIFNSQALATSHFIYFTVYSIDTNPVQSDVFHVSVWCQFAIY